MEIVNATTSLPIEEGGKLATRSEILAVVVNSSAANTKGCTVGQMGARLSLAAHLGKSTGDKFELDPKQLSVMVELFQAHVFHFMNADIVDIAAALGIEED